MIQTTFMHRLRQAVATTAILSAPLFLAACASTNLPTATIASVNQQMVTGYRISAGDQLRITVFDEAELTGEFQIGDGGILAMPLIDSISAGGLTTSQLTLAIANHYRSGGFVLAPRVSVEVLEHRPFFILGEVNEPGEYPYDGALTLEQAIAKAGGYSPRADRNWIILRREDWTTAKALKLDGTPLQIIPGDTITVRESFF